MEGDEVGAKVGDRDARIEEEFLLREHARESMCRRKAQEL